MTGNPEDETDQAPELLGHTNELDTEDAEFSLENRDDDLGEDDEGSKDGHAENSDGDDEFVVMHDMYGPSDFDN
jgi:hypothetical protein